MIISHTAYSFRFGVLEPKDVLDLAEKHGCSPLILAEVNGTAGILPSLQLAKIPIQPAVDLRVGGIRIAILLPESPYGFQQINTWLSRARPGHLESPPQLAEVRIIYPLQRAPERKLRADEWVGIEESEQRRAERYPEPRRCLAWGTMAFRGTSDFNSHRLLRAMEHNTVLSKLTVNDHLPNEHRWEDAQSLAARFSKQLWTQGQYFLSSLGPWDAQLGKGSGGKNQQTYTGSSTKDETLLRHLCLDAIPHRYPNASRAVHERLEKELQIIQEKAFTAYFLINWDIIRYAQKQSYFYVGRGSGANSIVAYLLKITNVDPIELDLYFERFINLYRQSPPDFDLDFSWRDRQHLTAYIFKRFPHTALLGACNTFQYRAVVRELGKVFGLPKFEIDAIAEGKIPAGDESAQRLLQYAHRLHGLPHRMSIHSGGILIAQEPLHSFSTTFLPPKGFPTVDFDMYTAEDVGLHKFDILGQRGLSKISECVTILKKNKPAEVAQLDIHDIARFKTDPKSLALLKNGGAMGCFYVESPAMRMLMCKLQTSNYLELVAASSVIRPGVAQSGMMREYIERHRQPERRAQAHPILLDIMPETYGVMVYQEDVIRVAHYYAGLSLAEADVLRRGMSGKYRSREEFLAVEQQFFTNCRSKGYPDVDAQEIWRQIESFAGYAFAKGHSASYAVESFQSLYLKAHFPLEYLVATINNGGGFYRAEFYLHEARRHGATIEAPCVNEGDVCSSLLDGQRILLGMERILGIDIRFCRSIVHERLRKGAFSSLATFIDRMHRAEHPVPMESLLLLIRIGGFRFAKQAKRALLWEAHHRLGHKPQAAPSLSLFEAPARAFSLPELSQHILDDAYDQLELLGFSLGNPFDLFTGWQGKPFTCVKQWKKHQGQVIQALGYVVSIKNSKTIKGEHMQFGTFQEFTGDIFDTVHFPPSVRRYVVKDRGVFILQGRVQSEHDYLSLEVEHVERCPMVADPRYADAGLGHPVTQIPRRRPISPSMKRLPS
ncbi:MAG: DNA polymerase III subunit alpha [Schleiferiaceae bacterium]|nr:DNA polymerase III subunit alpha [Schleiferiaceae bacterium]